MRRISLLVLCLGLVGCQAKPQERSVPAAPAASPPAASAPAASAAAASAPAADPMAKSEPLLTGPERKLGAEPKLAGEPVPVEKVLGAPDAYVGKLVKCEGKVARVCQAAGCWLELQAESAAARSSEGLRVPMAAHAFFIPQDAVNHVAVVEGELKRQVLPDAQKKHYEGEGMKAVGPLSLEATSVILR